MVLEGGEKRAVKLDQRSEWIAQITYLGFEQKRRNIMRDVSTKKAVSYAARNGVDFCPGPTRPQSNL